MKKFKKLLALSFCLVALTALISSCSKDDDNNNGGPYEVEYKVTASSNATISTVVYGNAQGDPTSVTSLSGDTWSKKLTVNAGVQSISIGANATATDANATLKVEIIINGKVVKENTGSGQYLTATAVYIPGT